MFIVMGKQHENTSTRGGRNEKGRRSKMKEGEESRAKETEHYAF